MNTLDSTSENDHAARGRDPRAATWIREARVRGALRARVRALESIDQLEGAPGFAELMKD